MSCFESLNIHFIMNDLWYCFRQDAYNYSSDDKFYIWMKIFVTACDIRFDCITYKLNLHLISMTKNFLLLICRSSYLSDESIYLESFKDFRTIKLSLTFLSPNSRFHFGKIIWKNPIKLFIIIINHRILHRKYFSLLNTFSHFHLPCWYLNEPLNGDIEINGIC